MTARRNDPCPCGSGKKYKKCCLPLDREAGPSGAAAGAVRRAALESRDWEVDIAPVAGGLRDDPASRLAVLFVVAQGLGIHSEALNRPSPEPEELAEALAKGVRDAAEKFGRFPERVLVREEVVAGALGSRLSPTMGEGGQLLPPPRAEAGRLDGLDEMVFAFQDEDATHPGRVRVAATEVWAAWGLPEELVERTLRAAAGLFRADPWRVLDETDPIGVATPLGDGWTVLALGRVEEGDAALILFSDPRDYERALDEVDDEAGFNDLEGRMIDLAFDPAGDVPRGLRREVESSAPELLEAGVCPRLITFNTPAGGLRRTDAEDLVLVLEALPRFLTEHEEAFADTEAETEPAPVEGWVDEETGLELSWYPVEWAEEGEAPDDRFASAYPYDPDIPPDPAEWLELTEGDRIDAVAAAHARTFELLDEGGAQTHVALQAAVETQIAAGDPEPVPAKVEELMRGGLTRHEALHALSSVVATLMWEITHEEIGDPDVVQARHLELLDELTAQSWLEMAEDPSA